MTTKVEIDSKLAKDISEIAKRSNISKETVLGDAVKRGLKELRKEALFREIEAKGGSIANKDTYGKGNSKDICGIIEAPEGFDVVKTVNKSREMH